MKQEAADSSTDHSTGSPMRIQWNALQNLTGMLPRGFCTGCSIIQMHCRLRAVPTTCSKIDYQCPLRFFILSVTLADWTFCLAASQFGDHSAAYTDVTERRVITLSIPLRVWYGRFRLGAENCNTWVCWNFPHSTVDQNPQLD